MTADDAAELAESLAREFGLKLDAEARSRLVQRHRPRFNVAPSDRHWVLSTRRRPVAARWGLVGPKGPQVNARAESIVAGRYPAATVREGRCAVVVDGFFEWGGQPRGPWLVRAPRGLMALASIAQRDADGTPRFAVVTCPPTGRVAAIHDRMPVLLDREGLHRWLDRELPLESVTDLLRAYAAADELVPVRVGPRVNDPRHDDAACLEPDPQGALFG